MIDRYSIIILISLIFNTSIFAAGNDSSSKANDYLKASNLIKSAKKYEKKGKIEKAKKKYAKAQKLLLKSNEENPLQADTLNYLGFTSRKIGNFEIAEKYYLEGLSLDPNHFGINEYLGELYVNTNRIEKAKERLKVLKNCNCEEFEKLYIAIKSGSSKY